MKRKQYSVEQIVAVFKPGETLHEVTVWKVR